MNLKPAVIVDYTSEPFVSQVYAETVTAAGGSVSGSAVSTTTLQPDAADTIQPYDVR